MRSLLGVTVVAAVVVACSGGDDGNAGGAGGTAGTSGTSGSAGTAGSAGNAGSSGTSGTAGQAGSAGAAGDDGGAASGGTSGSAGTGGTSCEKDVPGDAGEPTYPPVLSQIGLYSNVATGQLAPGVREYETRFELWADSATKKRYVLLPPGTQIDTCNMDLWRYPVGTKLFKEFSRDGKRIETRLLHKVAPASWAMISYKWRADGTDADALPDGEADASGTQHDIPGVTDCQYCHNGIRDAILGFTAVQLTHQKPGVTMQQLVDEQLVTAPPTTPITLPGTAVDQAALGYFHANCGHCHNDVSSTGATNSLRFWLRTDRLGSVGMTPAYSTTVNVTLSQPLSGTGPRPTKRIVPRNLEQSAVHYRMNRRPDNQMPPIATEVVHAQGVQTIADWIMSL